MKKFSKKIAMLCGMALCATLVFSVNDFTVVASEGEAVETSDARSTNLEWIYKEFDGVMYMRLWNHTTQEWETDWMLAW